MMPFIFVKLAMLDECSWKVESDRTFVFSSLNRREGKMKILGSMHLKTWNNVSAVFFIRYYPVRMGNTK